MDKLLLPDALRDDGNLGESWERFKREFNQFIVATEREKVDKKIKTTILLRVIGPRGNDIYENFVFDAAADKQDYEKKPRNEKFISRHRLLNMRQEGLTTEQYETKLRSQARLCEFGELTEDLTCHALVEGLDDRGLKDKLLTKAGEGKLDLTIAIKMAREYESAKAHMKEIARDQEEPVNKVGAYNNKKAESGSNSGNGRYVSKGNDAQKSRGTCGFCGREHIFGANNCPAFGKICNSCHRKNHFATVCKAVIPKKENDCKVMINREEYSDELLLMSGPIRVNRVGKSLLVELVFQRKMITCQLDTAAARNIVGYKDYVRWGKPKMVPSGVTLVTYDGTEMRSKGKVSVCFEGLKDPIVFEVIDTKVEQRPLIGVDTCLNLGLVRISESVNAVDNLRITKETLERDFGEVFKGLGEMPGVYEIQMDPDVMPVQHRPRKVPVALKEDVIAKLKQLEEHGVISRVEEPTPWISSLVALRKPNGSIRPCLDPKDLNKAIIRNHYQIPTIEDVLPKLTKAKCFSLLDAKDGFLQVKCRRTQRS
jgi:hypothetical protein